MGSSSLHALGLLFTAAGLVLLVLVNIGTTFTSSFLPKLYLVEATLQTTSVRFGPYNACIVDTGGTHCTKPGLAQGMDLSAFASGIDTTSLAKISKAYQFIVLLIPTSVFMLIAMFGWLMIRENRTNNRLPIIGAFASILGVICGTATLALTIVCYQLLFRAAQQPIIYHFGPSLYMLGVASCGCLLVSFILYLFACFRFKEEDDYTYFQKDEYDNYGDHRHY